MEKGNKGVPSRGAYTVLDMEGPGMKHNHWYLVSCRVDGKFDEVDNEWSYRLKSHYGDHDEIRPGWNKHQWDSMSPEDIIAEAAGSMLESHEQSFTTPFLSVDEVKGQRCDVHIDAHNSGVQVHYVTITGRALSTKEIYTAGSSTPFALLDDY